MFEVRGCWIPIFVPDSSVVGSSNSLVIFLDALRLCGEDKEDKISNCLTFIIKKL